MPGDTETVLSQEATTQPQVTPPETVTQPEKPPEATPEQKRHNYENASRRILTRGMRNQMAEMSKGLTEEEIQQVTKGAMMSMGFDPNDKDNEKQMQLLAKIQVNCEALRSNKLRAARGENVKQATITLAETLKGLGYDPYTAEGKLIGQHLFNKFDVDDPEVFRDRKLVEEEIEQLSSSLTKKKPNNPVTQEIIRQASTPPKSSESRSPDAATVHRNEDKAYANARGVSEGKAAKLRQLESKLPSWMK